MPNPLTVQVESYTGAGFIMLFTGFLLVFFFIAVKDMHSELDILNATNTQLRSPITAQRELIQQWMEANHIELPEGETYRYLFQMYPDKPWLH